MAYRVPSLKGVAFLSLWSFLVLLLLACSPSGQPSSEPTGETSETEPPTNGEPETSPNAELADNVDLTEIPVLGGPNDPPPPDSLPGPESSDPVDTGTARPRPGFVSMAVNPDLVGVTGRIGVTSFDAIEDYNDPLIQVTRADSGEQVASWYGPAYTELLPGDYNVNINNVRLDGLVVERRSDTSITLGGLTINLTPDSLWRVYDPGRETQYQSGYGTQTMLLPPGQYSVNLGGGFLDIEVLEGQVTVL